ncbi:SENSORY TRANSDUCTION HISTIDINE KINASE [hydrothermal vent metagenome]|uniref:SENSORY TRANSDUCTION HISTIDINE KINASE n=1 Tax=hydrothermal vent metagenome TaxID=652676 RepID=A0A1W1CEM9_9ZZZZ
MSSEINLPSFQHIDTTLGLKYLNGNRKLYLKILNNFLDRYQNLKIEDLNSKNLKDTMHTIKGLSSTLGMVYLSSLAKIIHETSNREKLFEFSKTLALIIDELQIKLKEERASTILIIDNISSDIDILVEFLGDEYDLIVTLNEIDALEIITKEDISIVLLYTNINLSEIYKTLKKRAIPVIFMVDSLDCNMIEYADYIEKPFNKNKLKKCIKKYFKFNNIG